MTIRLPPTNLIDRILSIFNIHRRIILPKDNSSLSNKNPYTTITAKKESLVQSLLRIISKESTFISTI